MYQIPKYHVGKKLKHCYSNNITTSLFHPEAMEQRFSRVR